MIWSLPYRDRHITLEQILAAYSDAYVPSGDANAWLMDRRMPVLTGLGWIVSDESSLPPSCCQTQFDNGWFSL